MFTYSLNSILEYKRRLEDLQKQGLASLEKQHLIEDQAVDNLRNTLDRCGLLPDNGWDYQRLVEYWEHLIEDIDRCNRRVYQLEQQVKAKKQEVVQAAIDRRKFELHREKKCNIYNQEQARKEQIELDELGCMAYLRQQGGD